MMDMLNRPKRCETCRYWDVHSLDMRLGDCRAPGSHRYSRTPMPPDKNDAISFAMLDSFGPEETRPDFVCGAWSASAPHEILA